MKELSIEEKAKRYDKAIAKGRQIQNTPYTAHWDTMKEVVEHLLPELKESEDDRIRKTLIHIVKGACSNYGIKYQGKEIDEEKLLAYLEKKGEKINIRTVNDVWKDMRLEVGAQASGNRHEPQYSDNSTKLFSLNDIDEIIEKISEKQDSAKTYKVAPKFKVGDIIRHKKHGITCKIIAIDTEYRVSECNGTHMPIEWQDAYELVEQNPAWSEEDEEMLKEALRMIEKPGSMFKGEIITKKVVDWLKSLKDKVLPQPKSIWSEEDEATINSIIHHFRIAYTQTDELDKEVEFLKTFKFRVQSQWKPSDEQINGIECAIKTLQHQLNVEDKRLNSLYNDLKKLK